MRARAARNDMKLFAPGMSERIRVHNREYAKRVRRMLHMLASTVELAYGVRLSDGVRDALARSDDVPAVDAMRARRALCREIDAAIFSAHPQSRIDLEPAELARELELAILD